MRFLVTVLCTWTGVRVVMLWPSIDSVPAFIRALAPPALAEAGPPAPAVIALPPTPRAIAAVARASPRAQPRAPVATPKPSDSLQLALALATLYRFGRPQVDDAPLPGRTQPAPVSHRSRLSGSAWLLWRGGPGRPGGIDASELGGAQAGIRLSYALGRSRRLAITARVAGALRERQREAAIGVAWQPPHVPVQLVVEQRIPLDGTRGGAAVGVIAGLNPTPIAAGFRLEAYGQAGAVMHRGGFADGAARIARPIATVAGVAIDGGAGAWGGAQRGAARLDIGPSLGASIPVAAHRLRVALDWRERIAGHATPESGIALSLGTDF